MTSEDQIAQRLRAARRHAGFTSASAAARTFGWNEVTYRAHENGLRGLRTAVAERYAAHFNISLAWLLTGEGRQLRQHYLDIAGEIGDDGSLLRRFRVVPPRPVFSVAAPVALPPQAIGFRIAGTGLQPRYDRGDIVVCARAGDAPPQHRRSGSGGDHRPGPRLRTHRASGHAFRPRRSAGHRRACDACRRRRLERCRHVSRARPRRVRRQGGNSLRQIAACPPATGIKSYTKKTPDGSACSRRAFGRWRQRTIVKILAIIVTKRCKNDSPRNVCPETIQSVLTLNGRLIILKPLIRRGTNASSVRVKGLRIVGAVGLCHRWTGCRFAWRHLPCPGLSGHCLMVFGDDVRGGTCIPSKKRERGTCSMRIFKSIF